MNESMLTGEILNWVDKDKLFLIFTGESVPVSKVPCTNESLEALDLASSSILPELARHFLFCGTKIVRARRPQDGAEEEAVGLALVVRTGFNTTKGALVRSMLFPKPSGFKFYRDSFYYISVMGLIAACGFVVSFINFIHLGVSYSTPNLSCARVTDDGIACMALDSSEGPGSYHYSGPSRITGDTHNRNKLRTFTTEEEADFLYQPTESQCRRKTRHRML